MSKPAFPLIRWTPIREQHLHGDHGAFDDMPHVHVEVIRQYASDWTYFLSINGVIQRGEPQSWPYRMQAIEAARDALIAQRKN